MMICILRPWRRTRHSRRHRSLVVFMASEEEEKLTLISLLHSRFCDRMDY
ncbi:hypothetical protein ABKV19_010168 [Rosa sericea]